MKALSVFSLSVHISPLRSHRKKGEWLNTSRTPPYRTLFPILDQLESHQTPIGIGFDLLGRDVLVICKFAQEAVEDARLHDVSGSRYGNLTYQDLADQLLIMWDEGFSARVRTVSQGCELIRSSDARCEHLFSEGVEVVIEELRLKEAITAKMHLFISDEELSIDGDDRRAGIFYYKIDTSSAEAVQASVTKRILRKTLLKR